MIKRKSQNANGRTPIVAALLAVLFVLGIAAVALSIGFGQLRQIWREQFRVEDRDLNVVISSGKMVHPDVITLHFGLTNGANLATIPFAELRAKLLERVPNIRDIRIERKMPNRVTVDVLEREPLARILPPRGQTETGRVADLEGVVFCFSSNTALLPIVREATESATVPGKHLTGAASAALRLIELASQPDFSDIRVLEIDTSHKDYLLVTFGNYDRARIAWDHMLEDSRLSRDSLRHQLKNLSRAMAQHLTPRATLWIATDWRSPGRVYASDPSRGNQ